MERRDVARRLIEAVYIRRGFGPVNVCWLTQDYTLRYAPQDTRAHRTSTVAFGIGDFAPFYWLNASLFDAVREVTGYSEGADRRH